MADVYGSLDIAASFTQALAATPGAPAVTAPQRLSVNLANGTAADQCDLKHTKRYSLVGSAQSIDLTAAVDDFGTVNFARVRSITVRVFSVTNGQALTIGGAAVNPWTAAFSGTVTLPAATANNPAVLAMAAPNTTAWAVGGTSKILKLDPGGATFAADVEITGSSV